MSELANLMKPQTSVENQDFVRPTSIGEGTFSQREKHNAHIENVGRRAAWIADRDINFNGLTSRRYYKL